MLLRGVALKRRNTARKGRELVQLAAKHLRSLGNRVETTRMAVRWLPWAQAPPYLRAKFPPGSLVPMSKRADFFNIWDLVYVSAGGNPRGFAQVTVASQLSARRRKILASGFPATPDDLILAYAGRPRRRFAVCRGPAFELAGEEWRP